MNSNLPIFTSSRQERLARYHHTDDGYVYSLRAIIKNDQGQILMMYDERYKTYTVPGGKWEMGDGGMLDSLQREVLEEIDCPIINVEYIGQSKCFREGGAVCHVYYDVTITGEPQLSEEHMTSFHRFSYVEMDGYLGYDILMDNQRQYMADNILKTWDLFDLVEYRYLITYTHHSDDWKVILPDVSSIIPDEYISISSLAILFLSFLKKNEMVSELFFSLRDENDYSLVCRKYMKIPKFLDKYLYKTILSLLNSF